MYLKIKSSTIECLYHALIRSRVNISSDYYVIEKEYCNSRLVSDRDIYEVGFPEDWIPTYRIHNGQVFKFFSSKEMY